MVDTTSLTLLHRLSDLADCPAWSRFDAQYRTFIIAFLRIQSVDEHIAEDVCQTSMKQVYEANSTGRFVEVFGKKNAQGEARGPEELRREENERLRFRETQTAHRLLAHRRYPSASCVLAELASVSPVEKSVAKLKQVNNLFGHPNHASKNPTPTKPWPKTQPKNESKANSNSNHLNF